MHHMTITEFRKNAAAAAKTIRQNVAPMLITQGNEEPLVIMPLSQFSSYEETAYLMRSPANRERLLASMKSNKGTTFDTIEDAMAFAEAEAEKRQ